MAGGVDGIARDVDYLLNVTCIVGVAAALEMTDIAREAAPALKPYAGRGVLNAGAVTFHGVVDDYLYRAARVLGDDDAEQWRHQAESAYRRIGARGWVQAMEGPRPRVATSRRTIYLHCDDAGRWTVGHVGETFTLADLKGLRYLRYLVQRPGADVTALALSDAVSDHPGTTLEQADLGDGLDATALAAYRHRLSELDQQLEATDRRGDQATAEQLTAERDVLIEELRSATGLGGRSRTTGSSTERARIAVRKAIATALTQIDQHAPDIARLLRDAVHTGITCRYDANPDHPLTWVTD